ncbi:MAG: ankyrin repeat domain-containing protein [Gemmatimonadota bacterium]|nr:ankyrin repeat domain-containing protein [Gemmatimonadota bacterium]
MTTGASKIRLSPSLRAHAWGALAATLVLWGGGAPEAPVADAAMKNDVATVRSLLRDGEDVNASQGDGMTGLHWAAEHGNPEMAELLLVAGANAGSVTRVGAYTPLHIAAKKGAANVVEVLLEGEADARARTSPAGVQPLHYAAASGSLRAVQALLEHGAEVDAKEPRWLQTPLMYAAAAGRTDVVRTLLVAGADASLTARVMDMDQRETQDREDRARQEQIHQQIMAAAEGRAPAGRGGPPGSAGAPSQQRGDRPDPGARPGGPPAGAGTPDRAPSREEINDQQRDRVPSSRYSHAQLVGGYGGLSPLHLAAREGHIETAMALVQAGVDIDQQSGGDHSTPLLIATINGHFDLAMRLFEAGADPGIASDANATPLYTTLNTQWIPKSRHPQPADYMQQEVTYLELMKAFLEAGVDPNVRLTKQLWFTTFGDDYLRVDRMGATPFWRAAYALDLDAMKMLVAYGADPNIPTMKTAGGRFGRGPATVGPDPSGLPPVEVGGPGAYPIHAATGVGYGEGYAANIHRVVPDGWLPAVRYLVEELGADVNARDHNGYNAVHHAASRGDNELILYLVEQGADVTAVSREGRTTVDMANGPFQRISPFPATIELLESLGAKNNHNCVSC